MAIEKTLAEEDKQLRDYELTVIISPEATDEVVNTTIEDIRQFVTGRGGTISEVEQWGKRKLAYPIKRFVEGNYVLTRFELKPTLTKELEASLQMSESVLRHLLVKIE